MTQPSVVATKKLSLSTYHRERVPILRGVRVFGRNYREICLFLDAGRVICLVRVTVKKGFEVVDFDQTG